jgi:CHAD domain-containing protein
MPHPNLMAASAAHPVRTLRELVTSLEAAITLALADPVPKAVHKVRTTTRRIEAQLALLALLPDLPGHAKPAKKAHKLLRKIRRAAGRVRDLDVQSDLVESKSKEADRLRSLFKRQRKRAAEELAAAIDKHQGRLTRALEDLLQALSPVESLAVPTACLAQLILDWYARHAPATARQNHRQLHDTRKAAKLARYLAESAPSTRTLARTFESLQQSGGNWHDWLTLSNIAQHELGASSPLAEHFSRRCQRSLATYQSHLKSLPKLLAPAVSASAHRRG